VSPIKSERNYVSGQSSGYNRNNLSLKTSIFLIVIIALPIPYIGDN
jgi:hypothetical protein